jgi:hypothetical protein
LKYYKTGIGVKKWQARYLVSRHRCLRCDEVFTLPNTPFVAGSRTVYGHCLMCWCVYQSIVGKQSKAYARASGRSRFSVQNRNIGVSCVSGIG